MDPGPNASGSTVTMNSEEAQSTAVGWWSPKVISNHYCTNASKSFVRGKVGEILCLFIKLERLLSLEVS